MNSLWFILLSEKSRLKPFTWVTKAENNSHFQNIFLQVRHIFLVSLLDISGGGWGSDKNAFSAIVHLHSNAFFLRISIKRETLMSFWTLRLIFVRDSFHEIVLNWYLLCEPNCFSFNLQLGYKPSLYFFMHSILICRIKAKKGLSNCNYLLKIASMLLKKIQWKLRIWWNRVDLLIRTNSKLVIFK